MLAVLQLEVPAGGFGGAGMAGKLALKQTFETLAGSY